MSSALLSLSAQRQLEQTAAGLGLMRRAARAAAAWIMARYPVSAAITVLAGPGNNGGDALHLACELAEAGYPVCVVSPRPQTSAEAQQARARWDSFAAPTLGTLPDKHAELIVDGLFGIGLVRAPAAPWSTLMDTVNAGTTPVLALDTPSGLDAMSGHACGSAIRARDTLTFLCFKPGLLTGDGCELAGHIHLATLDIPRDLLPPPEGQLNRPRLGPLKRHANSHK
ncbi:NAD(P)H-hydrate epimerase, partial [Craterilacuibacter sp.]|uniref:NAD(P)H-hydrate epimerase n=1 Tax=Craterilacuibacter sp. TaxID=2870909 RepID=UPI003F3723D6